MTIILIPKSLFDPQKHTLPIAAEDLRAGTTVNVDDKGYVHQSALQYHANVGNYGIVLEAATRGSPTEIYIGNDVGVMIWAVERDIEDESHSVDIGGNVKGLPSSVEVTRGDDGSLHFPLRFTASEPVWHTEINDVRVVNVQGDLKALPTGVELLPDSETPGLFINPYLTFDEATDTLTVKPDMLPSRTVPHIVMLRLPRPNIPAELLPIWQRWLSEIGGRMDDQYVEFSVRLV